MTREDSFRGNLTRNPFWFSVCLFVSTKQNIRILKTGSWTDLVPRNNLGPGRNPTRSKDPVPDR